MAYKRKISEFARMEVDDQMYYEEKPQESVALPKHVRTTGLTIVHLAPDSPPLGELIHEPDPAGRL